MPIYPNVTVELSGQDGNAVAIVNRTSRALRRGGVDEVQVGRYRKAALSGDYDTVFSVTEQWVTVE